MVMILCARASEIRINIPCVSESAFAQWSIMVSEYEIGRMKTNTSDFSNPLNALA